MGNEDFIGVACLQSLYAPFTNLKFRLSVCPQGVVIKSTVGLSSEVQKHPICALTVSITLMMIWWLRKAAWINASLMLMLFGLQNLCLWKKLTI